MDSRVNKNGWIEVITGPMFAGKSEELLRRVRRIEYAKKKCLVFKPGIDNRYSETEVVSHIKNRTGAISISSSKEIAEHVTADTDVVVIDEVQFLDDGVVAVANALAKDGKRVICAGLDMDFRGMPFRVMGELMCLAEEVTKLTAICPRCGGLATISQRLIDGVPARFDDPVILVGASQEYEPRCRHCHEVRT